MASPKQWMLGLPGHNEVMKLEEVLLLLKGGQLRPTDLVKKLGEPWRAANEVPELAEYFNDPKKIASIADGAGLSKPEPPKETAKQSATGPVARAPSPNTTRVPQQPSPPARPTTARAAVPERKPLLPPRPAPAISTAPTQRAEVKPAEAPKSETKPSDDPNAETPLPDEPKTETKPPEPAKPVDPLNVATKTPPVVDKPRERKTRDVPRPPRRAEPLLEPMVAKYFGPVDLLRCASFAFDPKKLLIAAVPVTFLGMVSGTLHHFGTRADGARGWAMVILAGALCVFGFAFIWTALAYLTRRQLEGKEYGTGEVLRYAASNLSTSLAYPLLALMPSLAALGILWIFRSIRNAGSGGASFLKIAYFIPMVFAFLAVAGALVYQLASMYIPAAAAIEGQRLAGAVNAAWGNVKRQWGRVVLHWLIITVAIGVITGVGLVLAVVAFTLPQVMFGTPEFGSTVERAWGNFEALFTLYQWLAIGLGMTLPVSLLSTLGTLSYLSLRHPGSAQLSPAPMDETSGIAVSRSGSSHPADATQPGETRPAPPDATPPPEITDDSDEQPLVKDA